MKIPIIIVLFYSISSSVQQGLAGPTLKTSCDKVSEDLNAFQKDIGKEIKDMRDSLEKKLNEIRDLLLNNSQSKPPTEILPPIKPPKILWSDECGENSMGGGKIMGGVASKPGQWPWMAAVGYKYGGTETPYAPIFKCGGFLITRRYVLTAAHCLDREGYQPYLVRLGGLDLRNSTDGINYAIEKVIRHHGHNPKDMFKNDIALFRLTEDVTLTQFIGLICIPHEPKFKQNLFENETTFVAGWGSNGISAEMNLTMNHVKISVVPNPTCKKQFPSIITEKTICAGDLAGGKDSCPGDSGGPLMYHFNYDKYYAIGVVSGGALFCGQPGKSTFHTRITEYIDWLEENIEP